MRTWTWTWTRTLKTYDYKSAGYYYNNIVVVVDASHNCQSSPSPLIVFCTAVTSTVDAFKSRPSHQLSLECVRAALNDNRIDLLTHWLSQDRYDSHGSCQSCKVLDNNQSINQSILGGVVVRTLDL